MSSTIVRISLGLVILLTLSLSFWKSSDINHAIYMRMENYVGGTSTLHFTFSLLIGFLAVFTFPQFAKTTQRDNLGLRLLLCLLLAVSLEELSQLFISNRTFSVEDLSTNWTGIILGYFIAKLINQVKTQFR